MNIFTRTSTRRRGAIAAAVACAFVISACASDASDQSNDAATQASSVEIRDPWIKAADQGMTAAFATVVNDGNEAVKIVSASAASAAKTVELHEMAEDSSGSMVMRKKPDGLTVKAGQSHDLDPGGDHLMFMDIASAIKPGDEVAITLTFADDSTLDFTAPARSFAGAQEDYDPNAKHGESADTEQSNGH